MTKIQRSRTKSLTNKEKITMGGNFKTNLAFVILFISPAATSAQDHRLTFSGTGGNTPVASVVIDNLTQETSLTINGNDVLHLKSITTGFKEIRINPEDIIRFSPNPMKDYSNMEFFLHESGNTQISVYDMSGREILRKNDNLGAGQHSYRLTGIKAGVYLVRVISGQTSLTGRFISSSSEGNPSKMEHLNSSSSGPEKNLFSKGQSVEAVMSYSPGDMLRFTGISGKNRTVVVEKAGSSSDIKFVFYECTDADANNYPVVQIGDQVWMAENLKTTKFSEGSSIPNITDDSAWGSGNGYSWYNNDIANKNKYGAMYTSWAAGLFGLTGTKNICPAGWHVPNQGEWFEMIASLDPGAVMGFVSSSGAGKLKEPGTGHWESPNSGATNETGFTALPGGMRNVSGSFTGIGKTTAWWSDDGLSGHYMNHESDEIRFSEGGNEYGRYVRCIKDK